MVTRRPLVSRFTDPAAFRERAEPFLATHEAEHNLLLGVAAQLAEHPDAWGERPAYQALVEADGRILAVAQRTPPRSVVLSRIDPANLPAVVRLFVDDLRRVDPRLPGVLGPRAEAASFATAWIGGPDRWQLRRAERAYQLTEVTAPTGVSGAMRRATRSDRELLARWLVAFHAEATGEMDPYPDALAMIDRWLELGTRTMWLWEDHGVAVAMAGTTGATPNGIRIGPVYTPPPRRRRGYAGALTAAVSQGELDAGRRFCFLFADLANATANHIYQEIGYRAVADVDDIGFPPVTG